MNSVLFSLTIILLILKVNHILEISYWVVFCPLWIPFLVTIIFIISLFSYCFYVSRRKHKKFSLKKVKKLSKKLKRKF